MPIRSSAGDAADVELRALLRRLHQASGLSYDDLAERANLSRSSIGSYLTKPAGRPTETLRLVLVALGASDKDRGRALELHQRTLPSGVDPAEVGWAARARAAECTVWAMAEFTAPEATVHTAIGRRRHGVPPGHDHAGDWAPPPYVPRAHDGALRRDIGAAAAGELQALIVVRGTSSTGKTRSLFEAVHALCPSWTVIRPRSAATLRRLPESGLFDRRCVVWLNELQGFLGPNGHGLSLDVLRDLYRAATAPVVLVSTLWPEKLRAATDGRDDRTSDTRDLLNAWTPRVRWHDVLPTLTTKAERAVAEELAATDPRLAHALADPDRFGFAQTLAGAHELLEHYHNAPQTAQLLLEAAADAHRLGHTHVLTTPLLRAVTLALWREEHGAVSPAASWFDHALNYAARPLRSDDGVRALIPLDNLDIADDTQPSGYKLADYLEQHLIRTRRTHPVPDRVWEALRLQTGQVDDLSALALAADRYGRYGHAEALLQKAAAADPKLLFGLASWLAYRPDREVDAEAAYREAAAAGDPEALRWMARWLRDSLGRETEAETAYREAAAAGDSRALRELAKWLRDSLGRETEAETAYREAAAAGDSRALRELAKWLRESPGRETEIEDAYRQAVAMGDREAPRELAKWLRESPGRETEIEDAYWQAVAMGDREAPHELVSWLDEPGREAEAEAARQKLFPDPEELRWMVEWFCNGGPERQAEATEADYRQAAATGDPKALCKLAELLSLKPGREAEVEPIYRQAAETGDPGALRQLADWLWRQPGREAEVEAAYREAAAVGDPDALHRLASWLREKPGREAEAEAAYRKAVAAGIEWALDELVRWMKQTGRTLEAERICRFGLDAHGRTVAPDLAVHNDPS